MSVEVVGAIPRPGRLTKSDLIALGPKTATWQVHGNSRDVTGVRLDKVLTHLGFSPGPMGREVPVADKRAGYRKVLRATARDGYQAVFSVAELSEGLGRTEVLVVWAVDGKALESGRGATPSRGAHRRGGEPQPPAAGAARGHRAAVEESVIVYLTSTLSPVAWSCYLEPEELVDRLERVLILGPDHDPSPVVGLLGQKRRSPAEDASSSEPLAGFGRG